MTAATADRYQPALHPRLLHHLISGGPRTGSMVHGTDVWSSEDVARLARSLADALVTRNVHVGDRIAIELDASPTAWAAVAACSMVGASFIPLGGGLRDENRAALLRFYDAAAVIRGGPSEVTIHGTARLEVAERPTRRTVLETDPAYIISTSGSTGVPKGIVMSHRAAVNFVLSLSAFCRTGPDDVVVSTAPLNFDLALTDCCQVMGAGARLIVATPALLMSPRRLVEQCCRWGATELHGVPSVWRNVLAVLDDEELRRWSTLRRVLYVGERFPPELLHRMRRIWPELELFNLFGQTEALATTINRIGPTEPLDDQNIASVGRELAGNEIVLVDDDDVPIHEPGVVGEMLLVGSMLFDGYWNDPVATAEKLVRRPIIDGPEQLVLRTGDLMSFDATGRWYFHGRADMQLKLRGIRVETEEIERVIQAVDGVDDVGVVLADATLVAYIVADGSLDDREIARACARHIGEHAVPRRVVTLDELPRTASGKVDRRTLVERHRSAHQEV